MKVNDYEIPEDLLYTREHEWVKIVSPIRAIVGITDYAVKKLRDIVYVILPEVNTEVTHMGVFGAVESIKTVADLYSPLSGTVIKVNQELAIKPELINKSPYGDGWLIEIKPRNLDVEIKQLLKPDEYAQQIKSTI
ncbi:MAG: glycine cleavage system protein GcvH [Nitrososphaerota archaeon]|nr:glycine cleavage system protein GcvH [Nitrososphaerales archaeon]MDW8044448.1 glycine cleavage system protein GcvH [Nitrososphaerota archaeon]